MNSAVIFDLDGVIVSTDEYHYLGWKQLANELAIPFSRRDNERCRGVSRMESLEILLEKAESTFPVGIKRCLAERKNSYYRNYLKKLDAKDLLPGVSCLLGKLKEKSVKLAIGSSSKNTPIILQRVGLADFFDAVADGNDITRSKPDPEVFLLAAERLRLDPAKCVVVEDAVAGVSAAINAGMKVCAVGSAASDARAHLAIPDLSRIKAESLICL